MTLRTYAYFICPNGHQGTEKTSENDQPYSDHYIRTTYTNLTKATKEGKCSYLCGECGKAMTQIDKPKN